MLKFTSKKMLKPLYLLLISIETLITLPIATTSATLSQEDIASISAMTDLIENDFRLANSSPKSSKWKKVSTKLIYFIAKPLPLPPPPKLLTSESQFLPRISDKFRARSDYYHPPVNHHYETNNYKTSNYDYKEYKPPPPPPVYKPPPIYIQTPVYTKEKEKDKFPLLLIGAALLFPLLALFLQFLLFLFFLQNVQQTLYLFDSYF